MKGIKKRSDQRGFTFVEIAIIAPIVILTIGAFITVVVSMTGDVLISRATTQLQYNVQDALNRIDQDVKQSSTFLAETNVPLTSPQGYGDDTTVFDNVDSTKGTMLVLNTLATTGNPLVSTSSIAYLSNSPNACGALQGQNTPMSLNVVYFIKNNSLWRRTIMPSNYATGACNNTGTGTAAPWQQPSCTTIGGFCKTKDEDLVDGVSTSGFTVQYYNSSNTTTENVTASANPSCNTTTCVAARNSALLSATTVNVTIDAHQTIAGKDVEQAISLQSTRSDVNATAVAPAVAVTIPSVPTVTGSKNVNGITGTSTNVGQATFTWGPSTGGGTIVYTLQYRLNGGSWQTVNNIAASGSPSYTIPKVTFNTTVDAQVQATNAAGTSAWSSTATVAVPMYATPLLQNGWQNYGTAGYSGQPYRTAGFSRSSSGLVSLKGLVAGGTSYPSAIFTLPVGFRPSEDLLFNAVTGSDTVVGRVDVLPDGTVTVEVSTSNSYVSLDNIRFMPAPPDGPSNFVNFTPLAGWVYYGSPYAQPAYVLDAAGRVQLKGLIKNGTTTGGTVIYNLPAAIQTNQANYIGVDANNAMGQIGISSSTNALLLQSGASSAFTSLQAMYYPTGVATWTTITLQNGWVVYSALPFPPLEVTKGNDGIVSLNGMIKSGTATAGTVIGTLPAGFRPTQEIIFSAVNNGTLSRIDVYPNGNIVVISLNTNTTYLTFGNLSFPAEQ